MAEAVESYLRQDFQQPSELIVVNDHPDVTIHQHESISERLRPGMAVRFVNWGKRMATLSDKFDYGVSLARYPLICMWDDDDLALEFRLQYSFEEWQKHNQPGYLSFDRHIYCDQHGAHLVARGIHGGDIMTAKAYWQVGGSVGDGHNDQNLVRRMKDAGKFVVCENSVAFYVYRWSNVGSHHSSHLSLADAMAHFDADVRRHPRYQEGSVEIYPCYQIPTQGLMFDCEMMVADELDAVFMPVLRGIADKQDS